MLKCSGLLMFLKKGLCLHHASAHSDCCLMLNRITQWDCLIRCTLSFLIISMALFSCICPISAFCKCTACVINNTLILKLNVNTFPNSFDDSSIYLICICHLLCFQFIIIYELQWLFFPVWDRGQFSLFCMLPDKPYTLH